MPPQTIMPAEDDPDILKRHHGDRPDIILLDVMMPGLDGPTTLAKLRRLPEVASIPIVFLTARSQPREIAAYKTLGAVDVIPKPFDPDQLCTAVLAIWKPTVKE